MSKESRVGRLSGFGRSHIMQILEAWRFQMPGILFCMWRKPQEVKAEIIDIMLYFFHSLSYLYSGLLEEVIERM